MGACCSATTTTDEAIKCSLNAIDRNIRKGAEGLLDFGFEYRCLPCPKHATTAEAEQAEKSPVFSNLTCMDGCSFRLFRIHDSVMVTTENRKQIIPPKIYDSVARVAQETVLQSFETHLKLKELPVFTPTSSSSSPCKVVHALVSQPPPPDPNTNPQNDSPAGTLLIINGRGVARAGILSTRHTIETGIEKGSAMFHIIKALERNMAVVCLDSNAQGPKQGLDTVCQSLASPALQPYLHREHCPIYALCHSAAGGNFVLHLLQQCQQQQTQNNIHIRLDQIQALVFTDSTHDLQWLSLQNNLHVTNFLQSPTCLYIRNNREHPGDTFGPNHKTKPAGEPFDCRDAKHGMDRNQRWVQRFGSIRTVYAGTMDHSLMCWQSRHVIWDFFQSKRINTTTTTEELSRQ